MVSEQMAMRVSTVFRCVSLISGLIAGLPLKVYKQDPDGQRTEAPNHRLAPLLSYRPYPGRSLTSFAWREMWGVNALLWGNHYSIIRYDNAGRVIGFEPTHPWSTQVLRRGGVNFYKCVLEDGTTEIVHQEDMIHIAGPGFDGVMGKSRIQSFARTAVSLATVLEEQTGRVHENAAKPTGMVTLPSNISPEGMRRAQEFFNAQNAGRSNAGRTMFVDKDTTYTPMQMTPEDLGTLAHRQYQAADICRFYGVPPHLVGESANTSAWGSGIEQLTIGFKQYTMDAELRRIEQEIRYKLFDGTPYYAEFDRDALLTLDAKTAAEVASIEINSGQLTPQEARRKKHRPDIAGSENLFMNGTMVSIERAVNPPEPAPAAPAKDTKNAP